jgi:hypothetical protein
LQAFEEVIVYSLEASADTFLMFSSAGVTRIYLLPSHDYLLAHTKRIGGTIAMVARKDDNTTGKIPREKDW